tara:strand:+ start:2559 stop:2738 length:180 start_codon:yes stop_codon:yes gene_type:complete
MIRVKLICETDGYKMYTSESGHFVTTYLSESFSPDDPEIGEYTYGMYLYSGSIKSFISD